MSVIILKEGREKALVQRHPWIFSGALKELPLCDKGTILPVHSSSGEFLAQAYCNPGNSLVARVLSFDQRSIDEVIEEKIQEAVILRERLFKEKKSSAYRLINGEGDGLPGLVVDRYDGLYVMQISTWGMWRLKSNIVDALVSIIRPESIYLKASHTNPEELPIVAETIYGKKIVEAQVVENGISFYVNCETGQKTGLFLDQRRMREKIQEYAPGRRVLNLCSYTGGFSLYALQGGALHVTSLDQSRLALEMCEKNVSLNGFSNHRCIESDLFDFLRNQNHLDADLIILDPPAFAKKREDVAKAASAYKEINRLVFQKALPRTLFLSASCSYHIDTRLFGQLLFQAALEAGRSLQILSRHIQAEDHPISLFHPEGEYLKSLLLFIK